MPSGCYKVQVLYYLNPHLIWVEVRDPEIAPYQFKFEQIGVYGLLPLDTTIDLETEELVTQRCEEWQPAATAQLHNFLQNSEVWFSSVHIDHRSSVFDTNIHKFGDLLKKDDKGKTVYLSRELSSGGFATYDACLFHQSLSDGTIKTKLDNTATLNVIKNIENFYRTYSPPKKNWQKPVKAQTSVSRAAIELEATLTATNLHTHNEEMKALIQNKNKDMELCKDVEERSVGRGISRKDKKEITDMERKLQILKLKRDEGLTNFRETEAPKESSDTVQAFEQTKVMLEALASPNSEKISDKTNSQKAQILKKIMCKPTNKTSKQDQIVKHSLNTSQDKSQTEVDENSVDDDCYLASNSERDSNSSPDNFDSNNIPKKVNVGETKKAANEIQLPINSCQLVEAAKLAKTEKRPKPEHKQPNKTDKTQSSKIEDKQSIKMHQKAKDINAATKGKIIKSDQTDEVKLVVESLRNSSLHSVIPDLDSDEDDYEPTEKEINEELFKTFQAKFNVKDQKQLKILKAAIKRCNEKVGKMPEVAMKALRYQIILNIKTNKNKQDSGHGNENKPFLKQTSSEKDSSMVSNPPSKSFSKAASKASSKTSKVSSKVTVKSKKEKKKEKAKNVKENKSKKSGKKKSDDEAKVAYGPPDFDVTKLNCRVPPINLYDEEGADKCDDKRTTSQGEAESSSGLEGKTVASCSFEIRRHRSEKKASSSSNSSIWEKRLKLHKEIAKYKRYVSNSSSTRDTSNSEDKTSKHSKKNGEESDDSVSDLLESLGICNKENSLLPSNNERKVRKCVNNIQVVKANPFQNFDPNISVFVDQLVTPIMMVHSKMNKRFTPTSQCRDVNFNVHVRLVLKNMQINKPMMLQTITWQAILRGYSVIMIGSASSGKTMGYLPAVCRLVTDSSENDCDGDSVGPICIIICATSQSVSDVARVAKMMVGHKQNVVSCYYGHDEKNVATTLLNGCDLLICTAPSLVRLLQIPEFGVDLRRLTTLVLDDCERQSEVYPKELKFSLVKIKEMLKARVNKELKVQYIVASRIWCGFMEPLAKKASDTVVCIGAFQECVLYARANMTVSYVKKENKLNLVLEFLEGINHSNRTVIVCDTDEEVDYLSRSITDSKYFIFASNNKMTVEELYNLSLLWREFKEPLTAPILICCDSNLYHMNIVNAHYLVQYSMPSLYSTFCRRFATLIESYPSIFKTDNDLVKILILLEENNIDQLPKIVNFVKRCSTNIPEFLDDICKTVLAEKDAKKAENFAPLCYNFLSLGDCPDMYNCKSRHTILKKYDEPKEWVPTSGMVTFKILQYHSAVHYSARLLANYNSGSNNKYPQAYSSMSVKMGMYYSKQKNKILLGIPKVGDVCAVALRTHLFVRCQVIKIINHYERGTPKTVLINLLDEELIEVATDTDLYFLPDDLKDITTYVVQVRLANVQPKDKDIVFSELALNHIKKTVNEKENIYMKGQICLTIGNCIFVDTLEACQDLKSLKETVVTCNVKRELLEKHAEVNMEHTNKLQKLCETAGLEILTSTDGTEIEPVQLEKAQQNVNWAYLDGETTTVFFRNAEDPDTFFVRLSKLDDCFKILIRDIQTYAAKNTSKLEVFTKGEIVLAEYPDDSLYERARIDKVGDLKVKCFFVDQGECMWVPKDKLMPIDDVLISQLPFQAIECRLLGVKPAGDKWTDFATNWLFDKCFESNGRFKHLYVQNFIKENTAQFTGGHKYGVVLTDTYGDQDVIINQALIDLNLASEFEDEMEYLSPTIRKAEQNVQSNDDEEEDDNDDWEKVSKYSDRSSSTIRNVPIRQGLLPPPIRSVPLVQTDDESDDSDKWDINMSDDLVNIYKPMIAKNSQENKVPKLAAIESGTSDVKEQIDLASVAKNIEQCTRQFQLVKINPNSKELDSDDLTASEASEQSTPSKAIPIVEDSYLRKPKLKWRQTKWSVMIKIQLIGAETYDLEIKDRSIKFAATVNDTDYGFEFDLYGVINSKTAVHSNKGQYILVKFSKIMTKNWLTLTKDGGIRKWIVYDVDSIDTSSSDEEEVEKDNLANIVKDMHNTQESDSDDDFVDDINFKYKRDN